MREREALHCFGQRLGSHTSRGYMLDRRNDSGVLTGTRDFQPDPKLNVSYHLQATCADNRDGTSIVFVTTIREGSRLQKMKQTTSMGVGRQR